MIMKKNLARWSQTQFLNFLINLFGRQLIEICSSRSGWVWVEPKPEPTGIPSCCTKSNVKGIYMKGSSCFLSPSSNFFTCFLVILYRQPIHIKKVLFWWRGRSKLVAEILCSKIRLFVNNRNNSWVEGIGITRWTLFNGFFLQSPEIKDVREKHYSLSIK